MSIKKIIIIPDYSDLKKIRLLLKNDSIQKMKKKKKQKERERLDEIYFVTSFSSKQFNCIMHFLKFETHKFNCNYHEKHMC